MAVPKRITKPMPLGGLRSSWPADDLAGQFTPRCFNVRFKFGEVRTGPGRGLFDRAPTSNLRCRNIGMAGFSGGMSVPYMFVDSTLGASSSLYIRGGYYTGIGNTWIKVNPAAGSAESIGLGFQGITQGQDRLFYSRGWGLIETSIRSWLVNSDPPVFSQINKDAGFEGISGLGSVGAVTARFLGNVNEHIIAASTSEEVSAGNYVRYQNRVRWSESGDYRKWDDSKHLGAGFIDLFDFGSEPIDGGLELGNDFVIYRANSITHIIPTFQLQPEFRIDVRVRGVGTRVGNSVASNGQQHFFVGTDGCVYSWNGSQLVNIGVPIQEEVDSLLRYTTFAGQPFIGASSMFGVCSNERQEYWLGIGGGSGGSFDVFVYDWVRNVWGRDTFPNLVSVGELETSEAHQTIRAFNLVGGTSHGETMIIDETYTSDYFAIGSIYDKYIETEDMYVSDDPTSLDTNIRLLLVYQYVDNVPFEAGISHDKGLTWISKMVTPVTAGFSFIDFGPTTGNIVRFRFRENNATGAFRWRKYVYHTVPGGEFIGTTT